MTWAAMAQKWIWGPRIRSKASFQTRKRTTTSSAKPNRSCLTWPLEAANMKDNRFPKSQWVASHLIQTSIWTHSSCPWSREAAASMPRMYQMLILLTTNSTRCMTGKEVSWEPESRLTRRDWSKVRTWASSISRAISTVVMRAITNPSHRLPRHSLKTTQRKITIWRPRKDSQNIIRRMWIITCTSAPMARINNLISLFHNSIRSKCQSMTINTQQQTSNRIAIASTINFPSQTTKWLTKPSRSTVGISLRMGLPRRTIMGPI